LFQLASHLPRALWVFELHTLVYAEVQVQLVESNIIVFLECLLVFKEVFEFVHQLEHKLLHACNLQLFTLRHFGFPTLIVSEFSPYRCFEGIDIGQQRVRFELHVFSLEHLQSSD